jgi:3-isopropylmalate/(R)-2-methylmalate dehydratase large subunit
MSQTLYEKLWQDHVVHQQADGTALIYIDRHLVHEVTSPQAFEGLKLAGRKPWRVSSIVATADHNTPTDHWDRGIEDPVSRLQVETLDANIREVGALAYFPFRDPRQGIVHVVGPESGATLPGMTVVCGDSHTSTHGAFACMAHGIGTSEVEHVLATQCLLQKRSKTMLLQVDGVLGKGVTAKDVALAIIGRIGTAGGTGYAIEFAGSAIRGLSMEGRMTLCNMAIEAGARLGLVAVDEVTIDYLRGRPFAPQGEQWERAVVAWRRLHSDPDAHFDCVVELSAADIRPQVTWGTSPEMVVPVDACVPDPASEPDPTRREGMQRALSYMGAAPRTCRFGRSGSTRSSSVRAPTRGSRICELPPGLSGGRKVAGNIRQGPGRSGLGADQAAGRKRGTGPGFHRCRLRVARAGLFDVSGDECRPPRTRRALCRDLES